MRKPSTVLIDGDELIYKTGFYGLRDCFEVYKTIDKVYPFTFKKRQDAVDYFKTMPEFTILKASKLLSVKKHITYLINEIEYIKDLTGTKKSILMLSDTENFRYDIGKIIPYKGTRDPSKKPPLYAMLREYCKNSLGAVILKGVEADDALGIYQKKTATIIYSQDKDLDMIPGWRLYRYQKGRPAKIRYISEAEGRAWFYKQLLMGDSTDNIPGIYRLGIKTAEKLINKYQDELVQYRIVLEEYTKALKNLHPRSKLDPNRTPEDTIKEIADLLWIRQEKRPVWEPPL